MGSSCSKNVGSFSIIKMIQVSLYCLISELLWVPHMIQALAF